MFFSSVISSSRHLLVFLYVLYSVWIYLYSYNSLLGLFLFYCLVLLTKSIPLNIQSYILAYNTLCTYNVQAVILSVKVTVRLCVYISACTGEMKENRMWLIYWCNLMGIRRYAEHTILSLVSCVFHNDFHSSAVHTQVKYKVKQGH